MAGVADAVAFGEWRATHMYGPVAGRETLLMEIAEPGQVPVYLRENGHPYEKSINPKWLTCIVDCAESGVLPLNLALLVLASLASPLCYARDGDDNEAKHLGNNVVRLAQRKGAEHVFMTVLVPGNIGGFRIVPGVPLEA